MPVPVRVFVFPPVRAGPPRLLRGLCVHVPDAPAPEAARGACRPWFRPIADRLPPRFLPARHRSEEHTSELQSLMRISYAVFCLKKKKIEHRNPTKAANTTI